MILDANAIVQPGTVVVEAFDTVSADRAVSATTCANCRAVRTELCGINSIEHVHKVNVVVQDVSGLSE